MFLKLIYKIAVLYNHGSSSIWSGFKLFACSTDMIRDLKMNIQFMAKTTEKICRFERESCLYFDNYEDISFWVM